MCAKILPKLHAYILHDRINISRTNVEIWPVCKHKTNYHQSHEWVFVVMIEFITTHIWPTQRLANIMSEGIYIYIKTPISQWHYQYIEMGANIQFKVQIMIQKLYNYIAQCLWHRNTKCAIFEHATFMMENESSNCNIAFFLMVTKYSYAILTARTSALNGDKIMLREWQQQHTLFLNLIQSEENYFFSECRIYLIDTKKLCYILLLKSILLYNAALYQ